MLVQVRSSASFLETAALACFDFDGLLVDTEPLHYRAYSEACEAYKIPLELDFPSYQAIANHARGNLLEEFVLNKYPNFTTPWEEVRAHTKEIYRSFLQESGAPLMPGVEEILSFLQKKKTPLCVVTNSVEKEIALILPHTPCLQAIPLWITKEQYDKRKPAPDGYLKAKAHFPDIPKEKVIGFEDSLKGLQALQAAEILPILVAKDKPPLSPDVHYFPSLTSMVIYG
ncbi:MAG: HAD family phosphatase [Verrucomicrobia bacterium]|nr:HAD family phosphatase [Verrucomicrobiota bacterium]